MITYGFIQIGRTNRERAIQDLEERKIRYSIAPLLQAEADYEYIQQEKAILAKERELNKDRDGYISGRSPYISGKWMPRRVFQLDKKL